MLEETITTTTAETGETTPQTEEKTFTQADVNRFIQERLAKEKSKNEAVAAQRETELKAREMQVTAREHLAEKGLPAALLEALNASTPEALDKSLELLEQHYKPKKTFTNPPPPGKNMYVEDETTELRRAMGLAR